MCDITGVTEGLDALLADSTACAQGGIETALCDQICQGSYCQTVSIITSLVCIACISKTYKPNILDRGTSARGAFL